MKRYGYKFQSLDEAAEGPYVSYADMEVRMVAIETCKDALRSLAEPLTRVDYTLGEYDKVVTEIAQQALDHVNKLETK